MQTDIIQIRMENYRRETEFFYRHLMYKWLVNCQEFEDNEKESLLDQLKLMVDEEKITKERRKQLESVAHSMGDLLFKSAEKHKIMFSNLIHQISQSDNSNFSSDFLLDPEQIRMRNIYNSYETYCRISRLLFKNGTSRARILSLLSFGCNMAVSGIKATGDMAFLNIIIEWTCEFFVHEHMVDWMSLEDGDESAIDGIEKTVNIVRVVTWIGALTLMAVVCYGCYRILR